MGPMTAAYRFVRSLHADGSLVHVGRIRVFLYGSLALTGKGHATDWAVQLGLSGFAPDTLDIEEAGLAIEAIGVDRRLVLAGVHPISFDANSDIIWLAKQRLPLHPNGLRVLAESDSGETVREEAYYSTGGGFVVKDDEYELQTLGSNRYTEPYPFASSAELLRRADEARLTIAELMRANEESRFPADEVRMGLDDIAQAMSNCIDRGLRMEGNLPGGLNVKRRAKAILEVLEARSADPSGDLLGAMDWVNLWAIAVNEENAAGGRIVTAPTNGAAGIVPAVLRYYTTYCGGTSDGVRTFLLTAAAIGSLYKQNASISGAEVGCQGEVGVACSMAAAGLCAALGGTNAQIENGAEIAMEHNLGLTCDPIAGLVQIPCIERNAIGAAKAIDAARLALLGDGSHYVSLDKVMATMKRTGNDMSDIYKETSLGGLAVNFVEC